MRIKISDIRLLLVAFMAIMLVVGCSSKDGEKETSKNSEEPGEGTGELLSGAFATGSSGGAYNMLGGGMLKVINEYNEHINLNATTPPSISQTPQALNDGQAVLGIGMMDMMQRAE